MYSNHGIIGETKKLGGAVNTPSTVDLNRRPTMKDYTVTITPAQHEYLERVFSGEGPSEIMESMGIPFAEIYKWYQDDDFNRASQVYSSVAIKQAKAILMAYVPKAVRILVELAEDEGAETQVRTKAAQSLVDIRDKWNGSVNGEMVGAGVYLIHSTSGHYKIGKSKYPSERLHQLQKTQGPFEYSLKCIIPTGSEGEAFELESDLHNHFSDKRVRGEWFELDENDVDYILNFGNGAD